MSKGPTSSGTITQNTVNPTQAAQLSYLQGNNGQNGGWNTANYLANNDPFKYYPDQTRATPDPSIGQGYDALTNSGWQGEQYVRWPAIQALGSSLDGGMNVTNSPAYKGLAQVAGAGVAGNPAVDLLWNNAHAGDANPATGALMQNATGGSNPALGLLADTAAGKYLGSNPNLTGVFNAAADPVTRAYKTATAPGTDSSFESAGRYGGGAHAAAIGQNEQNLGKTLGDLSANIYGADYANERGLQNQAAGLLGSNYLGGLGANTAALSAAGANYLGGVNANTNTLNSLGSNVLGGLNTETNALSAIQGGYDNANNNTLKGLALAPSINGLGATDAGYVTAGGQGKTSLDQQKIQDLMSRFYGEQSAPWQTNQSYLNQIGQPTSGSSSVTSPLLGPSTLSSLLSTGTGALSLYNGINGATGGGGLSSLFGGGSAASGLSGAAGLSGDFGGGGAALGVADQLGLAGAGGGAEAALPAAAMAWIICTELMKQDRLPKRYWVTGAKVFAAYPQIARDGYYVWAIPSVRHLRRRPNSLYSRVLERAFNWRAENIAAHAGVKGARKLWRGAAVTAALAVPCLVLGALCKARDWRAVYRDEGFV